MAEPCSYCPLIASAGLIGNIVVALFNNRNSVQIEKIHLQSSLIVESIKTDPTTACTNLTFLVQLGLLDDVNSTIKTTCASTSNPNRPSLGSQSDLGHVKGKIVNENNKPIANAPVTLEDMSTTTSADGSFAFTVRRPIGTLLHIRVILEGYVPTVDVVANGTMDEVLQVHTKPKT